MLKGGVLDDEDIIDDEDIKSYIKHLYNKIIVDLSLSELSDDKTAIIYKICVDIIKTILYDEILEINNTFNDETIRLYINAILMEIQKDQQSIKEKLTEFESTINQNVVDLREYCNTFLQEGMKPPKNTQIDQYINNIKIMTIDKLKILSRAIHFQSYLSEPQRKQNRTLFVRGIKMPASSKNVRFNNIIKSITNPVVKNYDKINKIMQNGILKFESFVSMSVEINELKTRINYIQAIKRNPDDFNKVMCEIITKYLLTERDDCPIKRGVFYAKYIYISYKILVLEKEASEFYYPMIPYLHPSIYNMDHLLIKFNEEEKEQREIIARTVSNIFCCKPGAVKAEKCEEILKVFPEKTFEVECKKIHNMVINMQVLFLDKVKDIKPKNIVFMNN